MALSSLTLENFKAFREGYKLELAPITAIIGYNSSGKSSVLHALAALKQTARQSLGEGALILDEDDAIVHLGRYIDAVHGQDYKTKIGLGISFKGGALIARPGKEGRLLNWERLASSDHTFNWKFSSTSRTQVVSLAIRESALGPYTFEVRKKPKLGEFQGSANVAGPEVRLSPVQNLSFRNLFTVAERSAEHRAAWMTFLRGEDALLAELGKVQYLGPFRQGPGRWYPFSGTRTDVGADGSGAIPLLIDELVRHQKRPRTTYVKKWLREIGVAWDITLARVGTSSQFKLGVTAHQSGVEATPADVGFGVSQVLPVVVQWAFAPESSTLLVEQPELHLHVKAQKALGRFLADATIRGNCTSIIETHSRSIIGGFQEAIRDKILKPTDVAIYAVRHQDGSAAVQRFSADEDGDLWDAWDRGFPNEFS